MDTTLVLLGFAAVALGAFIASKGLRAGSASSSSHWPGFGSAVFALLVGAATYGVQSLASGSLDDALCLPVQALGSQDAALGLVLSLASLVMAGRVYARRPASAPAALVSVAAAAHFYPALGAAAAAGIVASSFLRPLDEVPRPDLFRFAIVVTAVAVGAVLFRPTGGRWNVEFIRAAPGPLALALAPGAVVASMSLSRSFPRARDASRRGGEGRAGLAVPARSARRSMSLFTFTAVAAAAAALLFDRHAASLSAVCLGILAGGALVELAMQRGGRRLFAVLAGLFFVVFGLLGTLRCLG